MLLLSEGQMNDHKGARLLLPELPAARELLAAQPVRIIVGSMLGGLALATGVAAGGHV